MFRIPSSISTCVLTNSTRSYQNSWVSSEESGEHSEGSSRVRSERVLRLTLGAFCTVISHDPVPLYYYNRSSSYSPLLDPTPSSLLPLAELEVEDSQDGLTEG